MPESAEKNFPYKKEKTPKSFLMKRKRCMFAKKIFMELKNTFKSIIALHQEEIPFSLIERETKLPINNDRIVTVTGIRRCGKSSLLGLAINQLLKSGIPRERILYIGFDDERFMSLKAENMDDILQSYREMFPGQSLKDVYMFFDEIQLIEGWELFVLRIYKSYCKNIFITGSTAKMLSEEMSSALRGWPDKYREYTLSFQEYLDFKSIKANKYTEDGTAILANEFKKYCKEAGIKIISFHKLRATAVCLLAKNNIPLKEAFADNSRNRLAHLIIQKELIRSDILNGPFRLP